MFNGVDFDADLSTMYAEIRRCMAVDFPEDFCPEIVQEPGKELKNMNSEECEFYRKELVVSLGAKFNNRDSPRDKALHVKEGLSVTLSPCKQRKCSINLPDALYSMSFQITSAWKEPYDITNLRNLFSVRNPCVQIVYHFHCQHNH